MRNSIIKSSARKNVSPQDRLSALEVLGLKPGASDNEIKKAYHRAAKETHPDTNPGDPYAEILFKKVKAAYESLTGDAQEVDFSVNARDSSAKKAWDGSTGIVRNMSSEELAAELMRKVQQRMKTVTDFRDDLKFHAPDISRAISTIEDLATRIVLPEESQQHLAILKRLEKARPKMIEILSEKLQSMRRGALYEMVDSKDEEARVSLKGTMLKFFYASKDLKHLIFEIQKVIPPEFASVKRLAGDTIAYAQKAEREAPKALPPARRALPEPG